MGKASVNLQDSFLNQVRKENTEVKIVLIDGSILTGTVRGFDNFTIVLNAKGSQHLIYKHAVSQLISRRPVQKTEEEGSTEPSDAQKKSFNQNYSAKPAKSQEKDLPPPSPKKPENFNPMDFSRIKK